MTFQKSGKEQKKRKKRKKEKKEKEKKRKKSLNILIRSVSNNRGRFWERRRRLHTWHITRRAVPAKVVPCFLFSLHILQWKVLLLSTGWLTLMRNIPLYKTFFFFYKLNLVFLLLVFKLDSKKGTRWWRRGPGRLGSQQTWYAHRHVHTRACPSHSYILTHSALIPHPFPLQTVLLPVKRIQKAWLWQRRRESDI